MTKAIKLYETKDRDESHVVLAHIIGCACADPTTAEERARHQRALAAASPHVGKHPRAECREMDENGMFSVWSGPAGADEEPTPSTPSATGAPLPARLHPDDLDALAEKLAVKLR